MHVLYLHNLHYPSFLTDRLVIYCWKFVQCVTLKILKVRWLSVVIVILFSVGKNLFSIAFRTLMTRRGCRSRRWILNNNIAIFRFLDTCRMIYLLTIRNIRLWLTHFKLRLQVPRAFIFMDANRFQIRRKKRLALLKW